MVPALAKCAQKSRERANLHDFLRRMQLDGPLRDMADGPRDMWRLMHSPELMQRGMLEELGQGPSWFDAPLGFWPEPLMASAVALVKGLEGVNEVLAWLTLSRLTYGYAWRVLVDWRHLESVKDHPAFVEFIRAEDEMVEEIESAIDRGEYPL